MPRKRKTLEERLQEQNREEDQIESPKSQRRRRRRWPLFLVLLLLLVGVLPNLIGWLGLQKQLISYFVDPNFQGHISVESVSAGWLQPIRLDNIEATDEQGQPLFRVASIETTKPLYEFFVSTDYGQVNVTEPWANIELRAEGSNLEDAFSKFLQPTSEETPGPETGEAASPSQLPHLVVNITGGQADIASLECEKSWHVSQLNANAETSGESAPLTLDLQASIVQADTPQSNEVKNGGISLVARVDSGNQNLVFNQIESLVENDNFPVSLATPFLRRMLGPVVADGNLNGVIRADYDGTSQFAHLNLERLNLKNFRLQAPAYIGSDQITLNALVANGDVQVSPTTVAAESLAINSDVGKVDANGEFDFSQLANLANGNTLLERPLQLDGQIDLAKLVRMLPSTLQLHSDLDVQSGVVQFTAASRIENQERRMVVNLDTANLQARRGQTQIVWAQPLRIVGTILENEQRLAVEQLEVISEFLTLKGNANYETGSFVLNGNLEKLVQQLGQFVDLQGIQLAGNLDGKFGWQLDGTDGLQTGEQPIQFGGSLNVSQPVVVVPGSPVWQPDMIGMKFSGTGKTNLDQLGVEQGGFQVDFGGEQLIAVLTEPIAEIWSQETWNADCHVKGDVSKWLNHIRNFIDPGDFQTSGDLDLTCLATVSPNGLRLENTKYLIKQFQFDGFGVQIQEPKIEGEGLATYDLSTGDIGFPRLSLTSSSIAAGGKDLVIAFPGNIQLAGDLAFRGDVNRLSQLDRSFTNSRKHSLVWQRGREHSICVE